MNAMSIVAGFAAGTRPVRIAAAAVVMVATVLAGRWPALAAAPNVVLILSDDQHWSDYGFMGHEQLRTPALDRLARESLVFTRGYVPSSLCCPSLASLITGRYPHEHRIVGNDPPDTPQAPRNSPAGQAAFKAGRERMNRHLDAWPTLPKLLGEHGYTSLQTGKWWQGDFRRGGFDEGMTKGQRHGDEGLLIGRKTMEPIQDFVRRCRGAGRPFFVWYAPMLPHDPHDPPAELVEHYAAKTDSIHVARYWGNVERFDRTVGDLLGFLDQEQLTADTLVVYVCDNGWIQRPDSPRFAPRSKLSPYDGGLRTPIMLRRPGAITPRRSEALASSIDILPTVLAACGVPAPAGLPGVNLLDQAAVAGRQQLFGECYTHTLVDLDDPARSLLWRWTVRQDGDQLWKLVEPASAVAGRPFPKREGQLVAPEDQARFERGEVELFDVATDPGETKNLAADHPALVRDLRESLKKVPATKSGEDAQSREAAAGSPRANRPNLLVLGPRFDVPAAPPGDPLTKGVQDHPVYAGMIREMDETVAGVLAAVERAGQSHDTLVVFTSDNGGLATAEGAPTSNLPLRAGKGFVYEGGIRVPLIVRPTAPRSCPGGLPAEAGSSLGSR